jgi:hypothetical protein
MRCIGSLAIRGFGHHLNIAIFFLKIAYPLATNGMDIGLDDAYNGH